MMKDNFFLQLHPSADGTGGVVSSVYKSKPAKNCLFFAFAWETPAINHAFCIGHAY